MKVPDRIAQAAQRRIAEARSEIQRAAEYVSNGKPLQAEPERERAVRRVAAVLNVGREKASRIVADEDPKVLQLSAAQEKRAEAIQGKTVDYIGAGWLDAGRLASQAVGRIIFRDGRPQGTGFLVSDRLLLTNNHVIPNGAAAGEFVIEFGYELRLGARVPTPVRLGTAGLEGMPYNEGRLQTSR